MTLKRFMFRVSFVADVYRNEEGEQKISRVIFKHKYFTSIWEMTGISKTHVSVSATVNAKSVQDAKQRLMEEMVRKTPWPFEISNLKIKHERWK